MPKVPRRTTPAFGFSSIERALKDCLRQRQFNKPEQRAVVEFFEQWESQPECAFCGRKTVARWDHVVPVMKDGATVLGYIVLACQVCDDSKAQRPFDEWMLGSSPRSPASKNIPDIAQRTDRIRAYQSHFGYAATADEDALTSSEFERLEAVRGQLSDLRKEVVSLIADFRRRTDSR